MSKKALFFIYGRKEMLILVLLGILIALFAFTLGVHLGKKVGLMAIDHPTVAEPGKVGEAVGEVKANDERIPDRLELKEQSQKAKAVAKSALNEVLHSEVSRTGIQVDTPRQVVLPEKIKAQIEKKQSASKPKQQAAKSSKAFTIQVGSHPARDLAKEHLQALEAFGMQPFVREADIHGKRWYRVYLGKYESAEQAKEFGNRYKKEHIIDSFMVSKMPKDQLIQVE